jgi:hypothetical protein
VQCLKPVILGTREAKIRRIAIQGQFSSQVVRPSSQTIVRQSGTCLSSQLHEKHKQEDYGLGQQGPKARSSVKNNPS